MLTKPSVKDIGRSFRNEIDRAMLLEIDEDCSVDSSSTQSKVVDAEHTRRVRYGKWQRANDTEQGVATGGKAETPCCSRASGTTEGKAKHFESLREAFSSLCANWQKFRQTLSEGTLWTEAIVTQEATNMQFEPNGVGTTRKITRKAKIAAVDATTIDATSWAWGNGLKRRCFDDSSCAVQGDIFNPKAGKCEGQSW
jgi:hypothetical protein